MDTLFQDFRYAARTMMRMPGFAFTIIFVLTLGIAANTAIFGMINSVLLRPLPFGEPAHLVQLFETFPLSGGHSGRGSVSAPNFEDWREGTRSYEALALASFPGNVNLQSGAEPERLASLEVGGNLFEVLQAQPLTGRTFEEGDENVVLLSHSCGSADSVATPTSWAGALR